MAGLAGASFFYFYPDWRWIVFALLALASLKILKTRLAYVVFATVGLLVGMAYMSWYFQSRPVQTIDDYQFRKVIITGQVYGDPYWDEDRNYVFYLCDLRVDGREVAGEMRVKSLIGNAKEGYRVQVKGKVWPILGKTHNQLSFAKPVVLSLNQPTLVRIKTDFVAGVRRALPEPVASFMVGILIGARSNLPQYLQDNLNTIGLSHIVAVSGYNLTILTIALASLLGKKWRWAALVLSLWAILGFVLITGGGASILRAGIMATLFLLAAHTGKRLAVEVCLALGVLVTLLMNPTYLLTDMSWQLSFLSLAGIVFIAPKILRWFPRRGRLKIVSEILAVTLAAQITTLPLIAYTFGQASFIAPLANLLIMPLIPPLMLLGFIAGLAGMLLPNSAYFLLTPVASMTNLIIAGLNTMASYGWAAKSISNISLGEVIIAYIMVGLLALWRIPRSFKNSFKSGIIQDNNEEKEPEGRATRVALERGTIL